MADNKAFAPKKNITEKESIYSLLLCILGAKGNKNIAPEEAMCYFSGGAAGSPFLEEGGEAAGYRHWRLLDDLFPA